MGFVIKLSDMSPDHALEPTRLMTMSTSSNQRCLGYFMQQDNPKPREPQRSVIERPQTSHASFPWRHALETDDLGDVAILRAKFPGDEFTRRAKVGEVGSQILLAEKGKHGSVDISIGWGPTTACVVRL